MKAIQIKYLPPTNTRGTRLKVWAEGMKPEIYNRDYELEPCDQARILGAAWAHKHWQQTSDLGFGSLPNGDYVMTIGD